MKGMFQKYSENWKRNIPSGVHLYYSVKCLSLKNETGSWIVVWLYKANWKDSLHLAEEVPKTMATAESCSSTMDFPAATSSHQSKHWKLSKQKTCIC